MVVGATAVEYLTCEYGVPVIDGRGLGLGVGVAVALVLFHIG